jgi:hypothetical protein
VSWRRFTPEEFRAIRQASDPFFLHDGSLSSFQGYPVFTFRKQTLGRASKRARSSPHQIARLYQEVNQRSLGMADPPPFRSCGPSRFDFGKRPKSGTCLPSLSVAVSRWCEPSLREGAAPQVNTFVGPTYLGLRSIGTTSFSIPCGPSKWLG